MKKIKPILFGTPMVKAILEGRKSQTRRVIKFKKKIEDPKIGFSAFSPEGKFSVRGKHENGDFGESFFRAPICKGDILWVRETHTVLEPEHCEGMTDRFLYKASHHPMNEEWRKESIDYGYPYQWKPSIFMPKEACRIFLKVTNVRVERLQDISEDDIISEGIYIDEAEMPQKTKWTPELVMSRAIKKEWKSLWQSINGKESWKANPWVWVYEFKRVEKPENFLS